MELLRSQLKAAQQLKAAPALSSQEQHSGSVGSSSTSRGADDFFSMTEVGGGNAGFGSGSGFGNAGGMTEVKAKPKLGEGVQVKSAGVTGAAAASADCLDDGDCMDDGGNDDRCFCCRTTPFPPAFR